MQTVTSRPEDLTSHTHGEHGNITGPLVLNASCVLYTSLLLAILVSPLLAILGSRPWLEQFSVFRLDNRKGWFIQKHAGAHPCLDTRPALHANISCIR